MSVEHDELLFKGGSVNGSVNGFVNGSAAVNGSAQIS